MWQQLNAAYARDARQIFILNVGHLKGYEEPIQMYMDMAYDITKFPEPASVHSWLQMWATREFGPEAANRTADIMMQYSQMAARRKYELVDQNTYSPTNYNELENVVNAWQALVNNATEVYQSLPSAQQPSFWETVLHPATGALILHQVYQAVALNNLYALQRRTSTNAYAQQALSAFDRDHGLTMQWDQLLDGKWEHLVDQTHIGYSYWQQPMRNTMPPVNYVQALEQSLAGPMGISVEGNNASVPGDDQFHALSSQQLTLPPLDPYMADPGSRWVDIYSKGNTAFDFTMSCNSSSIQASTLSGHINPAGNGSDVRITVSADWSSAPAGSSMVLCNITNSANDYGTQFGQPSVLIPLNNTAAPSDFRGFVESEAVVSFEPEHFTNSANSSSANLTVIPGIGRTLSGLTLLPADAPSQTPPDAPKSTYDFYTFTTPRNNTGSVTVYVGDGLNTNPQRPMKYAVAVDEEAPQVIQPIPSTPLGTFPANWNNMIINAGTSNTTQHAVAPGAHTLSLWLLEPGLVVQKVVLDLGGVRQSSLGPPESVRV